MGRKFTDNALTTLAVSINAIAGTLAVPAGKGDNFPAVVGHGTPGATPDYFVITLEDAAGNREKIRAEQRAAGVDTLGSGGFPLVRGYDGTVARAWTAGDSVDLRWESSEARDLEDKAQGGGRGRGFGTKGSATSGLTYGYYGDTILVDGVLTVIADGGIALTGSQTNYVERTLAGVISANVVGFSTDKIPMAIVTTDASGVTSINDQRADSFYCGYLSKSVAGGAGTTVLTAADARATQIVFTGVLTGNRIVEFPAIKRSWIVVNNTSGDFTLNCNMTAGGGVEVFRCGAVTGGEILWCDGTNVSKLNFNRTNGPAIFGQSSATITPAQITANTNDYAPSGIHVAALVRLSTDASRNLTGLTEGALGRMLFLHNVGAQPLVFKNQDAGSAAANRFAFGFDLTLGADQCCILHYDNTATRWRLLGTSAAAADGSPGLIQGATQAEMEAASSLVRAVTPGRQHFHPSAAKAWVKHDDGTTINASYNVSSITDGGTGDHTVNFTTAFSSANYCANANNTDSGALVSNPATGGQVAGSCRILCRNCISNAVTDAGPNFSSYHGDQ